MTDNHPHTPTTARIKDAYRRSRVWESGNGSEAYEKEFDRWLATVEAAAEQRGAVRALRIASRDITLDNGFIEKIAKEYLEWAADRIEDGDINISKNDRADQEGDK